MGNKVSQTNDSQEVDVQESGVQHLDSALLNSLLKGRTTGRSIIWATDNYKHFGAGYKFKNQITAELITGENGGIIKPRVLKDQEGQKSRTKKHAEVFTPSWVCDYTNSILDDKIKDLPWQEYVQKT
ncbi:MAG: hypothetical protein LBP35_00375 [Candidatus Ancillula trichonymphae]|nr:hypothetical protein [Candidatus Ancillula trichonymphae]